MADSTLSKKRNKCEFTGNLTRDSELRYSATGTAKVQFSLAISNDYKKDDEWVKRPPTYLDFFAWGEKAEELAEVAKKGVKLNVEVQAEVDSWEDKTSGTKRSKVMFKIWDYAVVPTAEKTEVSSKPNKKTKNTKRVVEDDDDDEF